jgi:hypothetical protein
VTRNAEAFAEHGLAPLNTTAIQRTQPKWVLSEPLLDIGIVPL